MTNDTDDRMTNDEWTNEIRITTSLNKIITNVAFFGIRAWDFFRHSPFVIRHSENHSRISQTDQRRSTRQFHHHSSRDLVMPALLVLVPNDPQKADEKHNHRKSRG